MSDEPRRNTPQSPISSPAPVGPDYRPTSQLEKIPAWAIALTEKVTHGFASVDTRLDSLESETNKRLTKIEAWKDDVSDRLTRHSGGTRQLSDSDAKQDRAIAETLVKVRGLETTQAEQTAKLGDLQTSVVTVQAAIAENTFLTRQAIAGFFKTPLGIALLSLAMAAVGYATNWLTSHGGHP